MKYEIKQKPNPALEKSFDFALRIVKLYQHLSDKKKEFVLSKQILRSGTSIGANLEEAHGVQSDFDFQSKISIAYKEARETSYWLRLLRAANYITEKQFNSIYLDCEELIKITTSIQLSMKNKINERKTR
ncbi:MAG: four helix bundle protein [Lentisphaeria bacterium]|nr:four helix bundle protein [Lentisphaeria bacterium]